MDEEIDLTEKQKLFCEYFVSKEFFGNGTQAYIEAYQPDESKPNWYNTARSCASENLTKPNILNYINRLLDDAGLNDVHVDKQLLLLITQNADYSSKVAAIKEYNKLKARVVKKIEVKRQSQDIDYSKLSESALREIASLKSGESESGAMQA